MSYKYGVEINPSFYHYGGGGLGELVSLIPQSGEAGAGYLANEAAAPANAGKEISGLILTYPSAGVFNVTELSEFTLTGASDGAYTFTYQVELDGADGGIGTGSITVGVAVVTGATSMGDYIVSGEVATGMVIAPLPTVARPVIDTSNSGWLASTGSALFDMLDEAIPNDADYISTTSAGSVCQLALNNTASGTALQVFEFRAASANGNTVQARLKNSGGATVATWTQVLTPTPTTYQKALTAGEIALIGAGALSLELTAI